MSHTINNQDNNKMATPETPICQIKKVSIDETPCAPIKDTNQKIKISVEIPKFRINFDEKYPPREHETRLHRKTSYWSDEMLSLNSDKK